LGNGRKSRGEKRGKGERRKENGKVAKTHVELLDVLAKRVLGGHDVGPDDLDAARAATVTSSHLTVCVFRVCWRSGKKKKMGKGKWKGGEGKRREKRECARNNRSWSQTYTWWSRQRRERGRGTRGTCCEYQSESRTGALGVQSLDWSGG
jgi:hypothetical protein